MCLIAWQPHYILKSIQNIETSAKVKSWYILFICFNSESILKSHTQMLFHWSVNPLASCSDGFKGITESRQFISKPQAIRGCDYSHWGLYIEMFCPVALCEWEGSCPVKSHHSRTVRFLTLTPYALRRHNGLLFSRTLHDFCPGIVHAEVRCGRTGYQMRAMWRWSAAFVQTFTQGLRREGPRTGLRLLHDLRAELRPAVRRVHREMWLRTDLSASARRDETSAGSAGGTGDLCKRY